MATGKKLLRSQDRWIAGICGGIADYFDFDPAIVRIVYLLLTLFSASAGVPIYILLWLIMPKQ